jgi:uncharacterized membrane protein
MAVTVAAAKPSPAVRRVPLIERVTSIHPAALTLLGLATAWVVTFSVLVVRRHHGFWDVAFDMGIHDQAVWLLAHFRGFDTVRGLQVFGHHATPGYFLLVPAYWLGAGPDFLNVFQVVVLGLGVVPLYLLGRERNVTPWAAAALAAALLLHPATQFFSWELFHPEVIAITPLLCAYLCSVRRSWGWFTVWVLLAISWKEDVALAVVVLGLLIALRGERGGRPLGERRSPWSRSRRVGLITAATALAWFVLWTVVLLPAINGGHLQSEGIYTGVGGSPGSLLGTAFRDPGAITSRVFGHDSGDFAWQLVAPFGGIPVVGPLVSLIGFPQFFLDVISDVSWTRTISEGPHYAALPLAALALAMVEGVTMLGRRLGATARVLVPVIVLGSAIAATLSWGPSPISSKYEGGWWPPAVDVRIDAKRAAIAAVPDGASVSAVYGLVPQLSDRAEIYMFPNPWRSLDWGVPGSPTRNPRRVNWLVIDRTVITAPADIALLDSILGNGNFRIVFNQDDLLVAHRVRR